MKTPIKTISVKTAERYMEEYIGICIHCGAKQIECEPDARQYKCDRCGIEAVYGTEECIMMGYVAISGTGPRNKGGTI